MDMEKYEDLLLESKRTISKWEHEFQKANGRKPSKEDFKIAPCAVTEAYKTYYKIKKKQELVKNGETSPEVESKIIVQSDQSSISKDKEPENESKSSVWGDHLNKKSSYQEQDKPKTSTTGSSSPSYSKLTEKLMKGAKINIRTSLSRKVSNRSFNSLATKPPDVRLNSNEVNEIGDSDSSNQLLQKTVDEDPHSLPINQLTKEEESCEIIQGFKPKIVLHQAPSKKPLSLSVTRQRVPSRQVDLQWLDGCLGEGAERSNSANDEDQDVVYSTDDEDSCPRKVTQTSPSFNVAVAAKTYNLAESDQLARFEKPLQEKCNSEPSVSKRKLEEETPVCKNKRRKIDSTVLQENVLGDDSVVPSAWVGSNADHQENGNATCSVKENSVDAAKRERLVNKMASGTANQNFVRINLKKKVFARGKKTQTGSSYKRQQWKERQNMANGFRGGKGGFKSKAAMPCRRCGELGHWAKNCMSDKLLSMEQLKEIGDEEELEFPTLEEAMEKAEDMAGKRKKVKEPTFEKENDQDLQLVEVPSIKLVEPFCSPGDPVPAEVMQTLKKFGHTSFRVGQEEAIMRILSGKSTLVVQSTGSGKSLCYQLPAVLFAQRSPAITIVISPLVSLMEDQVVNLPSFVKAVCLHSGQTEGHRQKTLQALQSGTIHILLMSPESVTSTGPNGLVSLLRTCLPPIAFVCIDEAHCVSQWSHNFRPSYLRICKILREKMNIQTILGLTATAPKSTLKSIADILGVDNETGVIRGVLLPKNLQLTVSRDKDRDAALIQLLEGERFASFNSIIVYCIRREECERIAILLRTYLKDPVKDLESKGGGKRRGISWSAESYHAGLTAARRSAVQKQFMSGKTKIVVATVAFGMGINKSDIRGIIHYNAPKNFENYVQEIGRAGRDGLPAHCHVFLNSEGSDLQELKRFIYANSTDRHILRKLMMKILPEPCQCRVNDNAVCKGHEVALPIESIVQELDMPEENIATLLCQLESHPDRWVLEIGSRVYATCTIRCYGGIQQLKLAARECPPLGAAIALQKDNATAVRTFAVVDVARRIGWDSGRVKRELKQLEWDRSNVALGGKPRRSGIMVEFSDLAFHLHVRGDLTETERDAALEFLHQRCLAREATELKQLQRIHQALLSVSFAQSTSCCDQVDQTRNDKLRSFIQDYFEESDTPLAAEGPVQCPENQEHHIRSEIRSLINNYRDQTFTARAIARIFHGIASPCFPAEVWAKARKHWRAQLHQDFNLLIRMAAQELIALK